MDARATTEGSRSVWVLITGVAGFIGSWVAEALLRDGHEVLGLDCFTDFYPRRYKEANLRELQDWPSFRFIKADLSEVGAGLIQRWLSEYRSSATKPRKQGYGAVGANDLRITLGTTSWPRGSDGTTHARMHHFHDHPSLGHAGELRCATGDRRRTRG